jgi:hypothetical protein
MMFLIFGALLLSFLFDWAHKDRLSMLFLFLSFVMAFGFFLFHIYSPLYHFKMPWLNF